MQATILRLDEQCETKIRHRNIDCSIIILITLIYTSRDSPNSIRFGIMNIFFGDGAPPEKKPYSFWSRVWLNIYFFRPFAFRTTNNWIYCIQLATSSPSCVYYLSVQTVAKSLTTHSERTALWFRSNDIHIIHRWVNVECVCALVWVWNVRRELIIAERTNDSSPPTEPAMRTIKGCLAVPNHIEWLRTFGLHSMYARIHEDGTVTIKYLVVRSTLETWLYCC